MNWGMASIHTELRLLIIEDQPDDRELILLYLQSSGLQFRATFVDTLSDLRQALSTSAWEIVLSDYRLINFTSRDALAVVRELAPATPVIVISGFIGETAAVEILQEGAIDFVRKDGLSRLGPAIYRAIQTAQMTEDGRRKEAAIQESEQRFRTLTELSPVGIFVTDRHERCVYVNPLFKQMTGRAEDTAIGRHWRELIDVSASEMSKPPVQQKPANNPPLTFESRLERSDGGALWVSGRMVSQYDGEANFTGYIGVLLDVSEQKQAELEQKAFQERLRLLSQHLLLVEERQRASIARELHDDIGSSLTGMQMNVRWLQLELAEEARARPVLAERFADLASLVRYTAEVSHNIAKSLRPGILDQGIVPALSWLLSQHQRRFTTRCEFKHPVEEPRLGEEASISLFRVVQEALNNIEKHARATLVEVNLFVDGKELTLEITDNGRGLGNGAGRGSEQFGLLGMRERINSLGGWMQIESPATGGLTLIFGLPYRHLEEIAP